jgi:hypothetical protein
MAKRRTRHTDRVSAEDMAGYAERIAAEVTENPEPAWFDPNVFYAEVARARLAPEEMEN